MGNGEKLRAVWKLCSQLWELQGSIRCCGVGHSTLCHAALNLVSFLVPLWPKLFFDKPHSGVSSSEPSLGPLSTLSSLHPTFLLNTIGLLPGLSQAEQRGDTNPTLREWVTGSYP